MNKALKYTLRILLFIICVIILLNILPATDAVAVNPFNKTDKLITASQSGAGDSLPTNIMAAFNSASAYDIMYFSISVVMTSDEILVLADEDDLSAYTNYTGKISDKTYEEISAMNFAYKYTQDGKTYPYRNQQFSCVRLEDLLTTFPYSNFIINVVQTQEKGQRATVLLCELIRQNKLSLRVAIKGSDEVIDYVRSQTNVHILTKDKGNELNKFITLKKMFLGKLFGKPNFEYVEIPIDELENYRTIDLAALQNINVSVFVSGVDTKEELDIANRYNVDGIITNDPKTIMELLGTTLQN